MSVECHNCGHERWDHGVRRCNRISGIKPCLCEGFKAKEEPTVTDLKTCAFCNCAKIAIRQSDDGKWWWFECSGCEARGPRTVAENLAFIGWHMRAEVGELLNTKRVLEERVEQLTKGLKGIAADYAAEYPTIARRARRTLEENNEGDIPSPDGDHPSEAQPGV